jgi:hypothetical protein
MRLTMLDSFWCNGKFTALWFLIFCIIYTAITFAILHLWYRYKNRKPKYIVEKFAEDYAPWVINELNYGTRHMDFKVWWTMEELISYRPWKVYDYWTCHISYPYDFKHTVDTLTCKAAEKSRAHDQKIEDDRWERQYQERLKEETEACRGAGI